MYQVLYRKYRPQNFDDVVGQRSVVKTLKNAILNEKISHSYIFYGPRGTGKTTLAKIMARSINCEHKDGKLLCEKCDKCKVSSDSECVDIIEIDAASNNGVDEIRELKSKVNLVPSSLNYKIYIIDEVHMLSIGAFNALLKTIEEPPAHSIFILATTEIDKVPETIISRCQTFNFERVSIEDITNRLRYVADQENIEIDDDVLKEIAKTSEGGMRDSLGLLDKLSIYKNGKIELSDFYNLNSLLNVEELDLFIESLCCGKIKEIIDIVNKYFKEGKNIIQITNQLIYRMTDKIVDYYLDNLSVEKKYIDNIEYFANYLNEKMFDLKKSGNPNVFFEIMVLNAIRTKDNAVIDTVKIEKNVKDNNNDDQVEGVSNKNKKNTSVEKEIIIESVVENKNNPVSNEIIDNPGEKKSDLSEVKNASDLEFLLKVNDIRINNTLAEATKEELVKNKNLFSKFNDFTFDTKIGYLICDIMDGNIRVASSRNVLLSYEYDSAFKHNLENIDKLEKIYNKVTGLSVKLGLTTDENWKKLKEEYIKNKKDGIIYEYKDEPTLESEEKDNLVENSSSLLEEFGDVVEYE